MKRIRIEGIDPLHIKYLALAIIFFGVTFILYTIFSLANIDIGVKITKLILGIFVLIIALILGNILYHFNRIQIFVLEEKEENKLEIKEIE